ncbi:MAG: chorismate mutase [SAR324 cluster bacterium]|nr:chorismate mutase [SAR324 cluster bacterium]
MSNGNKIDLDAVRIRIDEIDQSLVELIAERFEITRKVGKYKKDHGLNPVDSERETRQFEKIAAISKELNVNPGLTAKILRLIIDEVVKNHKEI